MMSKSDPMCVLFMQDFGSTNKFHEVGRTEQVMNSLNPEFSRKFVVDYHFEESQKMKFELFDVDSGNSQLSAHDFLGRVEITLGELMSAAGSKTHLQLKGLSGKCGSIILSAEEVANSKEVVFLQFRGHKLDKKDFLGKSDPFLQIYRTNDGETNDLVHRSEVIMNNLNPLWKPMPKLSTRQLCHANHERQIRIECYDWDSDGGSSHDFIGACHVTLVQLVDALRSKTHFDLINPKKQAKKKSYKNSGQLEVMQCKLEEEYSFLDFIRGGYGTQINFTVAVDFTASNGNPTNPQSLHYIHPYQPNQYMVALKSVGEICQDYDSDKMFPALGFGAKLPPRGDISFEFFLNFHPSDPHVHRIEGVLEAYRNTLLSVQLHGPTNFTPVINHVARIAAQYNNGTGSHYFILLIITDGVISDMVKTKEAIISASWLPMSIIIVGVGNADFSAMESLDADDHKLEHRGRTAARDIVQFVPFRDYLQGDNFQLSQARLAKDVLAEIPDQLTGFMRMNGIKPKPPPAVDVSQLAPVDFGGGVDAPPQNSAPLPAAGGQYAPPPSGNPGYSQAPPGQGYQQSGAGYPMLANPQYPAGGAGPPQYTSPQSQAGAPGQQNPQFANQQGHYQAQQNQTQQNFNYQPPPYAGAPPQGH